MAARKKDIEPKRKELELGYYVIDSQQKPALPHYSTDNAACFDLYSNLKTGTAVTGYDPSNNEISRDVIDGVGITINPLERLLIPTGLILVIPDEFSVRIHPRSGLSLKHGLVLGNSEGVIDDDYYHELFIIMSNYANIQQIISDEMKIAQAEIVANIRASFKEIKTQPQKKTNRVGGFGHTDNK